MRELLAGKIEMAPLQDEQRGYHFRGALALMKRGFGHCPERRLELSSRLVSSSVP